MQIVLANQGLQWSDTWFLLRGAWNTILLTALAAFLGTILGVGLGWAARRPKRRGSSRLPISMLFGACR